MYLLLLISVDDAVGCKDAPISDTFLLSVFLRSPAGIFEGYSEDAARFIAGLVAAIAEAFLDNVVNHSGLPFAFAPVAFFFPGYTGRRYSAANSRCGIRLGTERLGIFVTCSFLGGGSPVSMQS